MPLRRRRAVLQAAAGGGVAPHYTERLLEAGIELSVGSVGDPDDNALAETVIGVLKTDSSAAGAARGVRWRWSSTLEEVDWRNNRRLPWPRRG